MKLSQESFKRKKYSLNFITVLIVLSALAAISLCINYSIHTDPIGMIGKVTLKDPDRAIKILDSYVDNLELLKEDIVKYKEANPEEKMVYGKIISRELMEFKKGSLII